MQVTAASIFFAVVLFVCIVLICVPNRLFSTRTLLRQSALISIAAGCAIALCGIYQVPVVLFVVGLTLGWLDKKHCGEQRFIKLKRSCKPVHQER